MYRQVLKLFLDFFFGLFLVILFSGFLQRTGATTLTTYHETSRSLGMGGVRIPEEDDAGILFYNPAGLGLIKGMHITLFNIGTAMNGLQVASDMQSLGQVNGLNSMTQFYGKTVWVGGDGYTSFAAPYFGFGLYDHADGSFRLHNPPFPELNLGFYNDYGLILGGAFPLSDKETYLGFNIKRIDRSGGPISVSSDQLMSFNNKNITDSFNNEGLGWGFDLGVLCRAQAPFKPTLSINWQNIGYTTFLLTKGSQLPEGIRDNLTLGLTFNGELPLLSWSGGVEYRHIGNNDEPLGKKIHIGTELHLALFDFRAGLYQGYPTYGVGLDLFILQLDLAYYGVEVGTYPGQTIDQRIQAGISFNLGFDPSFKFLDGGGLHRHLKQRR